MCEFGCCGEIKNDFIPLEEVEGPMLEYHFDRPISYNHIGRVVVLDSPTGLWAIDEEAKAKIKKE